MQGLLGKFLDGRLRYACNKHHNEEKKQHLCIQVFLKAGNLRFKATYLNTYPAKFTINRAGTGGSLAVVKHLGFLLH